jgi:threonine dehydratase
MINLKTIQQAQKNLDGVIAKTPISYAPVLSKLHKCDIFLKKENLQFSGSFKLRGAYNKISNLSKEILAQGIVAASAGNHAGGVAFSAKEFNSKATIFMPEATPLTKVMGVKYYGAKVVLSGDNFDECYLNAIKYAKENNKEFIHPFNDDDVINGQGSIGLEILRDVSDIDIVIIPVGGGGLISGMAIAIKALKPNIKIIGVVASGANAMKLSYDNKKIQNTKSVKTIADGIAVRDVDKKLYDIINKYVDEMVEVDDNQIASAILFLLEQQKIIVEGGGAVSIACLDNDKIAKQIQGKKVACLLSGGNIDVTMLSTIIQKGLVYSNRKLSLKVTLVDKPGSLLKLSSIFDELKANVVHIEYDRNSTSLKYGDAYVSVGVETKGYEHKNKVLNALNENGFFYKQI